MKNLHGYAREIAINEMMDKEALLNETVTNRGFEDELTIELFRMKERGETYAMMVEYKKLYENAEAEEWFGFEM